MRDVDHCVALRWLTGVRCEVLDPVSGLGPLTFLTGASTSTCIVMPVSVITNGACLSSVGTKNLCFPGQKILLRENRSFGTCRIRKFLVMSHFITIILFAITSYFVYV